MTTYTAPRGTCRVCGKRLALTTAGGVWPHNWVRMPCPGEHKPPKEAS